MIDKINKIIKKKSYKIVNFYNGLESKFFRLKDRQKPFNFLNYQLHILTQKRRKAKLVW